MRKLLVALFAFAVVAVSAQAAETVLRLAETHPKDYPTTKGDYKFAELVEKKTDGRIKVEVYHSKQLGEEKAVIEQVQLGAIDLTRTSISPLASFYKDLDVLQMPYLYAGDAHMWKVLKGEVGEKILSGISKKGFVGLCFYTSGARSFYTKEKVTGPADLKGLKIRVQQSKLMVGLVDSFGAVAQPMPFGEVYSALQTGVIDGAENNWPSYYSTRHYEVAPYYILDKHTQVPEMLVLSRSVAKKLSDADLKAIKEAAEESVDYQRAEWDKYVDVAKAAIVKAGNTITEVTDYTPFQEAVAPLYNDLSDSQKKLVEEIRAVK